MLAPLTDVGMALLQAALRRAASPLLRSSPACSSSGFSVRCETSDAIAQRAKDNEGNVITVTGAAFPGDLRSTSGLGTGDGIEDHTGKWLQVDLPDSLICSWPPMHAAVGLGIAFCLTTNSMSALQSDVSQGNTKSPMQYVHEHEPMKVHGLTVASYGCASRAHCGTAPDFRACLCKLVPGSMLFSIRLAADDPAMGAPVEYIDLRGTTRDKPATCKYTGNKYYSEVR